MPGRAPLIFCLVSALSVAGCFDAGGVGQAFDPIQAPIWEAGYSWTYDVTQSSHESAIRGPDIDSDAESQREVATFRVINTTLDVLGEPAYLVRVDNRIDHPLFEGGLQAFTKSNLEPAAVGHNYEYGVAYASEDAAYPRGGPGVSKLDPCLGMQPLRAIRPSNGSPCFASLWTMEAFSGAIGASRTKSS